MIGHLTGRVLASSPEKVLLDVHGVGYEVHVPLSTYWEIERAGDGHPVSVHVHTHLHESGLTLFGFWSEREKQLFLKLIGVGGIGPRLARQILSGSTPEELLAALAAGDVARLSRTPGVGKKTAERMIVELKDKVQELAAGLPAAPSPGRDQDLVQALVGLGYKESQADRAVAKVRDEHPDAPFQELLRLSLQLLSRA